MKTDTFVEVILSQKYNLKTVFCLDKNKSVKQATIYMQFLTDMEDQHVLSFLNKILRIFYLDRNT
jgi:hypothetical protein